MDSKRWKLVLYEWIKSTEMTDVTGSLDQVRLNEYFDKYRKHISPEADSDVMKFFKSNFPDYEILINDTNTVSMQDYIYIFSLFLYHSCVIKENEQIRKCCEKLEERQQLYILKFFNYMNEEKERGVKITKEMLRRGIKEAASVILSPPPFMALGSPIKTPTKLERSPPSKELQNFKLRELNRVKMQLENERFERNILEVEVKQTQEKIDSLVKKNRELSREVQSLRNHTVAESNDENLNPNIQHVEYIKAKMQKDIDTKDDQISDLKTEISDLSQCKKSLLEKINMVENERKELLQKLCDFDESVCSLQTEIAQKDEKIQYLEQSNEELVQILGEYRQKSIKDISSDCLEFSCSTYHTIGMSSSEGENLGSVIDLQLKDKESEVTALKEQLDTVNSEKENLQKMVKELKSQISSLDHDIKEHVETKKEISENLNSKIEKLKDRLKETMSIQSTYAHLEDELKREKIFSDKVNENNEVLTKKLQEARDSLTEFKEKFNDAQKELENVTRENEELKNLQGQKMRDLTKAYEEKFEALKNKMKKLYEEAMAHQEKKYSNLESTHLNDAMKFKEEIEEMNKKIKELQLNNQVLVKENQFLTAKWKYNQQDRELSKLAATSTPFDDSISPPIMELDEEFNNEFLKELKGEEDIDDVRTASELQMRNLRYLPHLRDSYATQPLDINMNEEEIKHGGGEKTPLLRKASIHQKKKDGTNYRRPSMLPTPSKNGRPSIGGSSTLRDATNSNTQGAPAKTPSKVKQMFARMSIGKDELSRRCKKITTSKRKRKFSSHADDEDSESPILSQTTQQRELNRKEKRKSAQDMNRPRLNEKISSNDSDSGSTIIVDENDDDGDWLEYDDENEARTNTSALDKSLEYVKLLEEHQKHQQKMRRKSFNNRRNSLIRMSQIKQQNSAASRGSNDFDKFKSCLSLASEESSFGATYSGGIHKTFTKSFINSHVPQLDRISDIYVPQARRPLLLEIKNDEKYNWKDATKPLPKLIIIILTLGILALAFLKFSQH